MPFGLPDNLDFQRLFKRDTVTHDNYLFWLHHQVGFAFILFGIIFIFGQNYLGGDMECNSGATSYEKKYCWLHGATHVRPDLARELGHECSTDQQNIKEEDERLTAFYIWLPFVLMICLVLVKVPRSLWKNLGERGVLENLLEGRESGAAAAEKIAQRFKKLKSRNIPVFYHLGFAFCEILNIAVVIICIHIIDNLLSGKFWSYGIRVNGYYSGVGSEKPVNPMCNVFPTVVDCTVRTGGITGSSDGKSHICLLSNNLFNQWYFLALWVWWVVLLVVSCLGLLYRLAELCVPAVSRAALQLHLQAHCVSVEKLHFDKSSDYFLMGRIATNVKGSLVGALVRELPNVLRGHRVEPEGNGIPEGRLVDVPVGNTRQLSA